MDIVKHMLPKLKCPHFHIVNYRTFLHLANMLDGKMECLSKSLLWENKFACDR